MTPIFSIIIPAFNETRHIGRCLDSIFAQRFPREQYEVIVIDHMTPIA
ncbi:MAG: glycosyltransferase [Desulfobacterium sp.]|nr:glycosyltransferase [Desulfobacterium sp.]